MRFFARIAGRLRAGGLLASSDLAADVASPQYEVLLPAWMRMMSAADVSDDAIERIRIAYTRDVAVLPPDRVAALVAAAGFEAPLRFHQAGMIHGWCARKR